MLLCMDTAQLADSLTHFLLQVEAGLGESELFYSLIIAFMYVGSVAGGFSAAFLVKFIPYWYLFIFFISFHVLGFILYATATQGLMLILAMTLIGLFNGGEVTLVFNYATDASSVYVETLKEKGKRFECDKTKAVQIRNYLYAIHSFGYSVGFGIGSG